MTRTYYLGLDVAKHKIRAALSDATGAICWEKDLPVTTAGRAELLAHLHARASAAAQEVLVLIEG